MKRENKFELSVMSLCLIKLHLFNDSLSCEREKLFREFPFPEATRILF